MKFLRFICITIAFPFLGLLPNILNAQSVEIHFRIHPQLESTECSKLFGLEATGDQLAELDKESDYQIILARGWVRLDRYNYTQSRKFYPCFQDLVISFPSISSFYIFAEEMDSCPQYPFYSGSDYALQEEIFKKAVSTGDIHLYVILLSKDGSLCASELNAPLYSILRENPEALVAAFDKLNEKQKQVAVATQYDFNLALEDQIITEQQIAKLPKHLVQAARLFNAMMRKESEQ